MQSKGFHLRIEPKLGSILITPLISPSPNERGWRKGVAQMAWEQRNGCLYYYRKMRRGRRVISMYIGTSLEAELSSDTDRSARELRESENHEWWKEKLEIEELDKDLNQVSKTIQSLLQGILLISNYHPHKGQWRQVRYGKRNNN